MTIEQKRKTAESQIQSAFLKGNTEEHLLLVFPQNSFDVKENEKIKIKFEVDTDPAAGAQFEERYRLLPAPYQVTLYDMPSLFAGKIHAVLCRSWKHRVKGRDLYDYVFYLSHNAEINIDHLNAKLVQTGYLDKGDSLNLERVKEELCRKFQAIDYELAKADVEPFLTTTHALDIWSSDFFCDITNSLLK